MAEIRELLESEDLGDAAHELKDLVGDAHEEKHHEPEGHGHYGLTHTKNNTNET